MCVCVWIQLQNGSEKADSTNSAQIEQLLQEKGEMAARIEQVSIVFELHNHIYFCGEGFYLLGKVNAISIQYNKSHFI